jgi:hypothetical protein
MDEVAARARINIPEGDHGEVLFGDMLDMVTAWTIAAGKIEQVLLKQFGEDADRRLDETVPTLAYAQISRTAWSLCSVARIERGDFDPVEFGRRCEAIAREQIERYRTVNDQAGEA